MERKVVSHVEMELILPPMLGQTKNVHWACSGPVLVIGANGAGKSRMGGWIEMNQRSVLGTHRITAQKSLEFPQDTPMMAHDDAELTLYIGHASYKTLKDDPKFRRKDWRWKQDLAGTRLLNDFQAVMGPFVRSAANRKRKHDGPSAGWPRERREGDSPNS